MLNVYIFDIVDSYIDSYQLLDYRMLYQQL